MAVGVGPRAAIISPRTNPPKITMRIIFPIPSNESGGEMVRVCSPFFFLDGMGRCFRLFERLGIGLRA